MRPWSYGNREKQKITFCCPFEKQVKQVIKLWPRNFNLNDISAKQTGLFYPSREIIPNVGINKLIRKIQGKKYRKRYSCVILYFRFINIIKFNTEPLIGSISVKSLKQSTEKITLKKSYPASPTFNIFITHLNNEHLINKLLRCFLSVTTWRL